jgi:DNA polymerase type B, organellar and viral
MLRYPYINKTGKYPVGHPVRITKNFKDVSEYFGLVKCSVLPPRSLLHPVIPMRCNGKLTFPLCRTCAEHQLQGTCSHAESERQLNGTWCTPEIEEALAQGYRVTKIEEVWHYEESEAGLFADYINVFLKIKTEASGWPQGVETDQQKNAYVTEFEKIEGIKLDKTKVAKNPGMRALAKLFLNSFWGTS